MYHPTGLIRVSTMGGEPPFAANAKIQADFHKADIRTMCVDNRSTNGSCADKAVRGQRLRMIA